jgi:quinoprotein glucose dehydrogenase
MPARSIAHKAILPILAAFSLAFFRGPAAAADPADPIVGPRPQAVNDRWILNPPGIKVEAWVSGLEGPWSLAFLPDGRALVAERKGRIRIIGPGGKLKARDIGKLDAAVDDESGLMGLAVHPQFARSPYVYVMYTWRRGERRGNQVFRFRMERETIVNSQIIVKGIPAGDNHNGGRIAFGPDGMLYVGTGDVLRRGLAQRLASRAGKILRVTPEGKVPTGNPDLKSPLWSLGHRNVQGLAWDPATGQMYASEHGPSGEVGFGAYDEINRIVKGGNYGWPLMVGAPKRRGYRDPLVAWPRVATPPSGMAFWRGDLYVATLGSEALVRISLKDGRATRIERWFNDGEVSRYGRLRDAVLGPDGALYVLTGNRDFRGSPRRGDDRILRITGH